ncbi:hypothetical protein F5B21DRAFT_215145 [Xylaria acuta]|nr:hypothetical protein F5B21DRAFT_215145 [Xylaria acuta]
MHGSIALLLLNVCVRYLGEWVGEPILFEPRGRILSAHPGKPGEPLVGMLRDLRAKRRKYIGPDCRGLEEPMKAIALVSSVRFPSSRVRHSRSGSCVPYEHLCIT